MRERGCEKSLKTQMNASESQPGGVPNIPGKSVSNIKPLLFLALPLYALDQLTKWWIFTHYALIPTEQNLRLFPAVVARTESLPEVTDLVPGFFQIVHWANTGAAFSVGAGKNVFFVVLSFVTLVGLTVFYRRGAFNDSASRAGVGLLIAGILGNLTDRLAHHYVVDFLLFDLHIPFANPWPAFNVADSCICVAVGIFLIRSLFEAKAETRRAAA